MITGILIAYASLTLPLVVYIGYKVYQRVKGAPVADTGANAIVIAVNAARDVLLNWLTHIKLAQDVAKRDHDAMLQATKAIAQSLLDIKGLAQDFTKAPTPEKSIANFVHSLEYARDTFAETATQKKVVQSIISRIKTQHGTESK